MFSDWSGNEDLHDKYHDTKTYKKRRRSVSVESENMGKTKKKKTKEKKQYKREHERDNDSSKNKSRKYNEKGSSDLNVGKARKSDRKSYSSVRLDSESENHGNKKIRKDQKSKYSNKALDSDEELNTEKYEAGRHNDDRNQVENNDKSKKYSSRKSKYGNDSVNEKEKKVDSEKKYKKGKYKENSDCRRNSREESMDYRNKFEDDDHYDRQDENSGRDDSDRHGSDKPFRYWSFSRAPVRKNSDSYWNKYSDRLKEPTEHIEVGPRYYSSGKERKDDVNDGTTKDKEKVDGGEKENSNKDMKEETKEVKAKQQKAFDPLTSRTGGAYIPPAKLKMMQESITDKGRYVCVLLYIVFTLKSQY